MKVFLKYFYCYVKLPKSWPLYETFSREVWCTGGALTIGCKVIEPEELPKLKKFLKPGRCRVTIGFATLVKVTGGWVKVIDPGASNRITKLSELRKVVEYWEGAKQ